MRKIMWKTAAVLMAAVLVLAGCARIKAARDAQAVKNAEPAAPPETVYAVSAYRAVPGSLDAYLEFGGDVAAASSVDIYPDANGKLDRLLVKTGDRVTRDQLLAQVDPSRPGMNYAPSPVRAPTAGTVTSLPFAVGTTVSPAMSIGKISSANDLEIAIDVPERFVSRIRMGQAGLLVFDAYPGEIFNARVVEISPVLNTVSRTMSAKLRLDSPDSRIKIGMYARVRLITDERKNVIVVPNDAVVRRAGKSFVFLVQRTENTLSHADTNIDGQNISVDAVEVTGVSVAMTAITEGIRVDDRIEILGGIKTGDEVVVQGQTLLNDGSKVNVIATTDGGIAK